MVSAVCFSIFFEMLHTPKYSCYYVLVKSISVVVRCDGCIMNYTCYGLFLYFHCVVVLDREYVWGFYFKAQFIPKWCIQAHHNENGRLIKCILKTLDTSKQEIIRYWTQYDRKRSQNFVQTMNAQKTPHTLPYRRVMRRFWRNLELFREIFGEKITLAIERTLYCEFNIWSMLKRLNHCAMVDIALH